MSEEINKDYKTGGFSILFADDQQFMLKNLERYFKNYFDVKSAASLNEAKTILDNSTIGIVVSDHQMAEGHGIDILKYTRDNYPRTRRILITADRHEDVVISMMEEDLVHSFAYKPTVKKQLHVLIEEQADIFTK